MRVVVFGVDGLSFRILRPLIERGDLPNFARLAREGVSADFISSVPSVTPPAWMSMMTGVKPAKHGVFDFFEYDIASAGGTSRIVTHRKGAKALWNILSDFGKRVIVMNVPFTYPPEAVNGVMVSGFMTPGTAHNFTYPAALRDEIADVIPDYRIDVPQDYTTETILDMTEKRIRLQEHLLSEHEWDVAILGYVGPDRLQHRQWDAIATLTHEETVYFRLLDDALGRVLARLTPEDALFVASDHGFVGAKTWFYINDYLRRRKLLQYGTTADTTRARLIGLGREAARQLHLLGLTRRVRAAYERHASEQMNQMSKRNYEPFFTHLDWNSTRACVVSPSMAFNGAADIYLAPDLEPEDVEELRLALEAERHPETGEPLARAVYATDAFGVGPYRPPEEHIILVPRSGITFHLGVGRPNLWETLAESKGVHEQEGIFYAWGNGIRQGERVDALQICDLVPTALHALGISADEPFDGRVAHEIFAEQPGAGGEAAVGAQAGESLVARKLRRLRAGQVPATEG